MRERPTLQAQCEACEAFIDSQRHEGWVCQRAAYDGGFSGATMNWPALKQLLADVKAGRVDTIVVYKIDFGGGSGSRTGSGRSVARIAVRVRMRGENG